MPPVHKKRKSPAKLKKTVGSQRISARKPKLLVQPEDGAAAILDGIAAAKKSIDILIFRFDHRGVEEALLKAVGRGVRVRAIIAYTNRGGEKYLRALEMRLLGAGIAVARSAADLARYHAKVVIVDARRVFVLGFNFTYLDIEHSRSFGVILEDPNLVREALKLFEADMHRQAYAAGLSTFLVSPVNARAELSAFLAGAKEELLIYDPNVSDTEMLRVLADRLKAGVKIRILGTGVKLPARKLAHIRLHARVIVRDRRDISLGSQSLRKLELDARREVGVVFRDLKSARRIAQIFEADWDLAGSTVTGEAIEEVVQTKKIAKRVAKEITKDLPQVAEVLDIAVKEVAGDSTELALNADQLQDTVKDAVKRVVKEAVRDAVDDLSEHGKA
jgi:cardiolipin synthase